MDFLSENVSWGRLTSAPDSQRWKEAWDSEVVGGLSRARLHDVLGLHRYLNKKGGNGTFCRSLHNSPQCKDTLIDGTPSTCLLSSSSSEAEWEVAEAEWDAAAKEALLDDCLHSDHMLSTDGDLLSTRQTAVNLTNAIVGAGMLTLPYAIQQGGWMMLVLTALISLVMGFTAWLIGHLLDSMESFANMKQIPRLSRDWGMLGQAAFGGLGMWLVTAFCILDLYGTLLSYTVMAGVSLQVIVTSVPLSAHISIVGAVTFALLFVPTRYLAVVGSLGILSSAAVCGGLLLTGAELELAGKAARNQEVSIVKGMPSALGIVVFLFNAHSTVPFFYQSMKVRDEWSRAVTLGVGCALGIFLVVGGSGYLFFGTACQQAFTANLGLGTDLRPLGDTALLPASANAAMGPLCGALVAIKLIMSFPVFAAPILLFAEKALSSFQMRVHPILLRCVFIGVTTMLALILENKLAILVELVGCVVQNGLCVIFPCAISLRMRAKVVSWPYFLAHVALIAVFSANLVSGLCGIILSVIG